jgi:hypothetical protein
MRKQEEDEDPASHDNRSLTPRLKQFKTNPRKWNPHRSDTKAEATQVPNPKGRNGKETKKPR